MSTIIFKKVLSLERKRQNLISQVLVDREMVRGSFCEIRFKCKKTCNCNEGRGHTHKRMSLREQGKSYSRAVPREDYEWIQKMTDNFREYRNIRKELAKLDKGIHELLNQYEDGVVAKYKKGKPYLNVGVSEPKVKKASENPEAL